MNDIQKRALQYIKNTGGNATLENFYEDHEPVGEALWDDLDHADLVCIDDNGKVALLPKAEAMLAQ